jgi:hypothetical protein
MKLKYFALRILVFVWYTLLPLLTVLLFAVAVGFNLVYEWGMLVWPTVIITLILGAGLVWGLGRLLRRW